MALAVHDWFAALGDTTRPDAHRCSGQVVCLECGYEYYDHPRHPAIECLTITCQGEVVKL